VPGGKLGARERQALELESGFRGRRRLSLADRVQQLAASELLETPWPRDAEFEADPGDLMGLIVRLGSAK